MRKSPENRMRMRFESADAYRCAATFYAAFLRVSCGLSPEEAARKVEERYPGTVSGEKLEEIRKQKRTDGAGPPG